MTQCQIISIIGFDLGHVLEHMFIEVVWGNKESSEDLTRLAGLQWKKSRHRITAIGLVEKPSVQSPCVTIGQKCGVEFYSTPRIINLNSLSNMIRGTYSLLVIK